MYDSRFICVICRFCIHYYVELGIQLFTGYKTHLTEILEWVLEGE
ncbi:hypothetical protein HMPREF0083_02032 [Aneurinibacillus aneurinilyticus ATCC 12856]|uniref:Uncharacterized protein n=1 Tax=Aneurinibacillus aneurinilyticus ATCC 12856 TaxID=649747 RepID=U1X5Q1_ANEAE|nr:hypothetical protein HMPREF0083_02032 [Aneurinibacillus aneurinilyticus ATCC 12856]